MRKYILLGLFCLTTAFFTGCGDIVVMTNQPTETATEATTEALTKEEVTTQTGTDDTEQKFSAKVDGKNLSMTIKQKDDIISLTTTSITENNEKALAMLETLLILDDGLYQKKAIQEYGISIYSEESKKLYMCYQYKNGTLYQVSSNTDGTSTSTLPDWLSELDSKAVMNKYYDNYVADIMNTIGDFIKE